MNSETKQRTENDAIIEMMRAKVDAVASETVLENKREKTIIVRDRDEHVVHVFKKNYRPKIVEVGDLASLSEAIDFHDIVNPAAYVTLNRVVVAPGDPDDDDRIVLPLVAHSRLTLFSKYGDRYMPHSEMVYLARALDDSIPGLYEEVVGLSFATTGDARITASERSKSCRTVVTCGDTSRELREKFAASIPLKRGFESRMEVVLNLSAKVEKGEVMLRISAVDMDETFDRALSKIRDEVAVGLPAIPVFLGEWK